MKPEAFLALGSVLPRFFEAMDRDPRLSTAHISLYFSLIRKWACMEYQGCIRIYSSQGAKEAKMCLATYRNCLRELHEFGYLKYVPSFNKNLPSSIYLFFLQNGK